MRMLLTGVLLSVSMMVAAGATAQPVNYGFTAFSSYPNSVGGSIVGGSFSILLPSFVTSNIYPLIEGSPVSFSSCEVTLSNGVTEGCSTDTGFVVDPVVFPNTVRVAFGSNSLNMTSFYYFDENAFAVPGIYDTVVFGPDQAGRLSVTLVPEPATWMMLSVGLILAGLRARRTRPEL